MAHRNTFDRIAALLHIKGNTEGTSNEISFSVLDAYRKKSATQAKRKQLSSKGGSVVPLTPLIKSDETVYCATNKDAVKNSIGGVREEQRASERIAIATLGQEGGLGQSNDRLQENPSKDERVFETASSLDGSFKKRRALSLDSFSVATRPQNKAILRGILCATLIVGIGLFGYWGIQAYLKHEAVRASEKHRIEKLVEDLEKLDAALIIPLDDIIGEKLDAAELDKLHKLSGAIEENLEKLKELDKRAKGIQSELKDEYFKNVSQEIIESIASREVMLKQAKNIESESTEFFPLEQKAREIWTSVEAAENKIALSNRAVSYASKENTAKSNALLEEARDIFVAAQLFIEKSGFKQDLEGYYNYITLEIEAIEFALESNKAALEFDKELANKNNELFNKKTDEVNEQLGSLEVTLPEAIHKIYEQKTQSSYIAYQGAREQAALSDSYLREYLKSQQNHQIE